MPVIILLETASIIDSVLHPSGTTLKDVLTQAIFNLLESLRSQGTHERVAILHLGGGLPVHSLSANFTSIHSALSALNSQPVQYSNVEKGIADAAEYMTLTCGADVAFQLIMIGFAANPLSPSFATLTLPFMCNIHCFMFDATSDNNHMKPYEALSARYGGQARFVAFETDGLSALSSQLEAHMAHLFESFTSKLMIGHLQFNAAVLPSPRTTLWNQLAVFHRLPLQFPTLFSVSGFLPTQAVIAPPSIARFMLAPYPKPSTTTSSSPAPPDRNHAGLLLLADALHRTNRAAVVQLGPDWYGLVVSQLRRPAFLAGEVDQGEGDTSASSGAEHPADESAPLLQLVLIILTSESQLPFIGPLKDVIVEANFDGELLRLPNGKPSGAAMPSAAMDVDDSPNSINVYPLPVMGQEEWPSYNPKLDGSEFDAAIVGGDPGSLVIELARLQSLVLDLPNQRVGLFRQCERLRQYSVLFGLTGLMESIAEELSKDVQKRSATTLTGRIVGRLVECIEQEDYPLEWSDAAEDDITKARERTRRARKKVADVPEPSDTAKDS